VKEIGSLLLHRSSLLESGMATPEFLRARRHLARRDKVLRDVMRTVGPCTLQANADHFSVLARSIISQQISTKAARAIADRLVAALGRSGLKPKGVLALSPESMRAAGLSANKQRSLRDLAERCASGDIPLNKLAAMDDEAVIEALIPVHGIGRWTAEMFLIFSLGRLDVFPVADYGLKAAVKRHYAHADLPTKAELDAIGSAWQPFRSVGTWYMWRSLALPSE
jgi:DNA-3-methyladenine glycosylase II